MMLREILRTKSIKLNQDQIDQLVDDQLDFVKNVCNPRKVILIGSALTSHFDSYSDLDLVVIFDSREEAKLGSKMLYRTSGKPSSADYICVDQQTFDEKSNIGGVFFIAKHDGKLVYSAPDGG